jgi:hemerythrin
MAHYDWTADLEIGEETVDTQHKWLVDTYNYLMAKSRTEVTTEWIVDSLVHLYEYTENHFAYEEAVQVNCRFPEYEKHKMHHEKFKQKALELVNQLKAEGPTEQLSKQLNATIGAWLIKHIKTEDSKIAAYIRK